VDSMRTPPKIHSFYGESMDFGWTMISFCKIYHILFFINILAESLNNGICNEKNVIILTTYNIGRYNIDNKIR
jgi:hypothetical protein